MNLYRLKRLIRKDKYSDYHSEVSQVAKKSRKKGKKRLFIDCGTNLGQGYNYFKNYFPLKRFDLVMIEPNQSCLSQVKAKYEQYPNVEFIQAAAWTEEGSLKLFGLVEDERGDTSQGASVVAKHNGNLYEANEEQAVEVPAISLNDLIVKKAKDYDSIILKMDIESAEYKVLTDMLAKGSFDHIDHIFVEFHGAYFSEEEQPRYVALEKDLLCQITAKNVSYTLWY